MKEYHYTECGLDDVILCNLDVVQADDGEEVIIIPYINLLHKKLASIIITADGAMSGKELRFLRTHLRLTQDEMAHTLHKGRLTIGRWERGESVIDNATEIVVRGLVAEHLVEKISLFEVSEKCVQKTHKPQIKIDGSDPKNYSLIAA